MKTRILAGLCALAIVGIVIAADTRHLGLIGRVYDYPNGDKLGHFLLFGFFSLLVNLAAFETWPALVRRQVALRASLLLALLIGAEELSQRWFPSRTSDILDLMASYAGVTCFALLALWIAGRRSGSTTRN